MNRDELKRLAAEMAQIMRSIYLRANEREDMQKTAAILRQLADAQPVAFFQLTGEIYEQVGDEFAGQPDVFPLYTLEALK